MESTNVHIAAVRDNFPIHAHAINYLYNQNSEFRTLCEDYHICLEEIHKITTSSRDQELLEEYHQLREALEKELVEFLLK